ncbi:hypothetical protein EYF80_044583 [Liparis tanakae]|uniref:Uncharacterized protein n=1 Tax=Liparis tanakae TaxID=230148 RepID=A0A4Z2FWE4_9TELE|nr:hypothetical protein EYF80_044583 [Liparis tanakae]
MDRLKHKRGGNGEQNLVFGIILGVSVPPQYLKHGLHNTYIGNFNQMDNICIEGHQQRDALGAIGVEVLLDGKAAGIALFNSEHRGEESDVPQHHIMKKGPQENAKHSGLWDSI